MKFCRFICVMKDGPFNLHFLHIKLCANKKSSYQTHSGDFIITQIFRPFCDSLHIFWTQNYRIPTVRESQGILSESGKVRENREGQGKVREF